MTLVRKIRELELDRSRRIALVPTMGAFHEGHLHLMRRARDVADVVVVSLFVNPAQFAAGEDFERYPRDEQRDFALAEQVGVDVMFAPTVAEMYPPVEGQGTREFGSVGVWEKGQVGRDKGEGESRMAIHVGPIGELWEGAFRPGHFDGVATVVAKLFNIVRPNLAMFGLKDFQQCRVIEQMVEDLNFPIKLIFEETVREADGLAMSSRNAYLNQEERAKAPMLHRVLAEVAAAANDEPGALQETLERKRAELSAAEFVVDYLEVVDARSLEPARAFGSDVFKASGFRNNTQSGTHETESSPNPQSPILNRRARAVVAARLGPTRLIDNVAV